MDWQGWIGRCGLAGLDWQVWIAGFSGLVRKMMLSELDIVIEGERVERDRKERGEEKTAARGTGEEWDSEKWRNINGEKRRGYVSWAGAVAQI